MKNKCQWNWSQNADFSDKKNIFENVISIMVVILFTCQCGKCQKHINSLCGPIKGPDRMIGNLKGDLSISGKNINTLKWHGHFIGVIIDSLQCLLFSSCNIRIQCQYSKTTWSSIYLTMHLLSIPHADWPKQHGMFKDHDITIIYCPFLISLLTHLFMMLLLVIESRYELKANHVLPMC